MGVGRCDYNVFALMTPQGGYRACDSYDLQVEKEDANKNTQPTAANFISCTFIRLAE